MSQNNQEDKPPMSSDAANPPSNMDKKLRETIITKPDVILDDNDLMKALVEANDKARGENIVDLRGVAMDRLETRLERLEDTHRNVIAAAYENLAGTNQIHRAILRLLDATDFEDFLKDLGGDVADILRVDAMRLVLETKHEDNDPNLKRVGDVLSIAEPGFIDAYLTGGRGGNVRQVTLREVSSASVQIYGDAATSWVSSEACLKLDFGEGRLPGMLVMGAEDVNSFNPQQGSDLLAFFAGVFERAMRRWLA